MKRQETAMRHGLTLLVGLIVAAPMALSTTVWAQADLNSHEPPPSAVPVPSPTVSPPTVTTIPVDTGGFYGVLQMDSYVYLPPGVGPYPVMIFAHGRSGFAHEKAGLRNPVLKGHVDYWQRRGFAVVASIRPGYGETGGPDPESSGAYVDASGQCHGGDDSRAAAHNGAKAIKATLAWVQAQSWAIKDKIILEGVSAGGFTTATLAAENPPGVIAFVNFSGGISGYYNHPDEGCAVAQTAEVFAEAGATRIPSIWLYAQNDHYWGPERPKQWYKGFAARSSSKSEFHTTGPVPGVEGHYLMARGGALWGDLLTPFLTRLGFPPKP